MYEKFVSITLISWIGEVKFCKRWTDHTRSGFVARLSVLISIVSYELRCADSLAGCGVGGWGINTFLFFFSEMFVLPRHDARRIRVHITVC